MCLRAVGSVIRCMRRLEEALREMCQAAKTIGNTQLENKFSEGRFDCCNTLQCVVCEFVKCIVINELQKSKQ